VMEAINPTESAEASLDQLFVSVTDDASVTETAQTAYFIIDLNIFDLISATESTTEYLDSLFLSASDDSLISESTTPSLDILYLSVAEPTITVSEFASILDLVVEMEASDSVIVTDNLEIILPWLSATIDEVIASAEAIANEMPINFFVAEQKGISIITVADF
jgi:hypothetical protein